MTANTNRKLIFDIGLHKGLDAAWYMAKGFDVVGIEAIPYLCEHAAYVCKDIGSGSLTVVQKALFHRSGETVTFYTNPDKDDWGSLEREHAEKGIGHAQEITVDTVSLGDLIAQYGLPYYIKCDIEGGDTIFAEQLVTLPVKPPYVSLELTKAIDLARLGAAGYTRFQIVNQYFHPWRQAAEPAREGKFAPSSFNHETSGVFGLELDPAKWMNFEETMRRYVKYFENKRIDDDLAIGWIDVHASMDPAVVDAMVA